LPDAYEQHTITHLLKYTRQLSFLHVTADAAASTL